MSKPNLLLALSAVVLIGAGVFAGFSVRGRVEARRGDSGSNPGSGEIDRPTFTSEPGSSKATTQDSEGTIAERFQSAVDWNERYQILLGIPAEQLLHQQDFLWRIAEGTDVPAVRDAALRRIRDLGRRSASSSAITGRLCARLHLEPVKSLRYFILDVLGDLYVKHMDENAYCFDAVLDRLKNDPEVDVRDNAASVLGYFVHSDRQKTLATLRAALETEPSAQVREAIQRRIEQVE